MSTFRQSPSAGQLSPFLSSVIDSSFVESSSLSPSMLLAPRSCICTPMIRRAYTKGLSLPKEIRQTGTRNSNSPTLKTFAPPPQVQLAQIPESRLQVPTISTLRPEKLVHSDLLVLAGSLKPSFHTRLSLRSPVMHTDHEQSTVVEYQLYGLGGSDGTKHGEESGDAGATNEANLRKQERVPFPGHAQGFLYLRPSPEPGLPGLASSIRFRCAPSLAPASPKSVQTSRPRSEPVAFLPPSLTNQEIYKAFQFGYDLVLPNGYPWRIPVVHIAGLPSLKYLRMQLLEDGFFSESEFQEYADVYKIVREGHLLHKLRDVFPVRFNDKKFTVWTATTKEKKSSRITPDWEGPTIELYSTTLIDVFGDSRSGYYKLPPYTGAAHVRFEIKMGKKRRKLCLRIVKIIEEPKCVVPGYDHYIHVPEEGELHWRGLSGEKELWVRNLNPVVSQHHALLHLLSFFHPAP